MHIEAGGNLLVMRRYTNHSRLNAVSGSILTGLALLVSVGTSAGQAEAAADTVTCATVSSAPAGGGSIKLAGTTCFHSYGDYFTVKDERADGYHIEVWWEADTGPMGECRNIAGAGKTTKCDYDLKEGSYIWFNAMVVDNATTIMGGATKHAVA
ncbi:hypothetical protein [Streptomyces sp. ITFR-16]|uniref:hypothetical protein n=1 Tax=Streptomyces sp. ITFR-16 TaxID=3075198 RepID=UPI002889D227|nr:hypothetical protein [Streptomyces sp. ITFR-16]WNI21769.1 hypothetical protein RLT58_07430 [Streptomyces sp. ITFR-16]